MKKVDVYSHFLPNIYQAALEEPDKTWPDGVNGDGVIFPIATFTKLQRQVWS
jgi:hypothetical protein